MEGLFSHSPQKPYKVKLPLKYNQLDFYMTRWFLLDMRLEEFQDWIFYSGIYGNEVWFKEQKDALLFKLSFMPRPR